MDAFVCYAPEDSTAAEGLAENLARVGWTMHLTNHAATGDQAWRSNVEGIRAASVFLIAWSAESAESPDCRAEWEIAAQLGMLIIQVQVGAAESADARPFPDDPLVDYQQPNADAIVHIIALTTQARELPLDQPTGGVFICYRREETGHAAGRIADRLRARFSDVPVFMDVESIEPGIDFGEAIEQALARCSVLLVLIGRIGQI